MASIVGAQRRPLRWTVTALAAGFACQAGAFQFDSPEDWSLRWDNTVKLSTKYRTRDADRQLADVPNQNAGDENFRNKGIISRRADLLSEFDAVYRKDFGLRLSAAAWYDVDYHRSTDAIAFTGQTPNDQFAPGTRNLAGRKAEMLDWFVFGGTRLGNGMKVTGRLGQHALQWGETLFFGDNGIARAQGPLDIDKLLASPGALFKEFIRPVPQISGQVQLSPGVSLAAYYQFRWEADRLPPAGSYFSNSNNTWGPSLPQYSPAPLFSGPDRRPKDSGQFGLQMKWNVDETDLGLYFARFHDKDGQILAYLAPIGSEYYWRFPKDVRTVGFSASRSLGDYNLAGEVSFRDNMPLRSTQAFWGPVAGFVVPGAPGQEPAVPRGKTAHANVSWLASLGPNFLSQVSSFIGELAWNRVLSRQDPGGVVDRALTRDATALRLSYTPTYRQVLPGLDLSVPFGVGYVLRGFSSVTQWMAEDNGDVSLGVDGTYLGDWNFSLKYTKYIGKAIPFIDANAGFTYGVGNPLADRDFISLALRRTF
jgi:hypothetical protein